MIEEWRDVIGYEGYYKVSNTGRVYSCKSNRELKPSHNKFGYLQVSIGHGALYGAVGIHVLVAKAFIPNPNNYTAVNHKDEDKENNCVENLEWITHQQNKEYSSAKRIQCIETGVIYRSLAEASRQTGINKGNMSASCLYNKSAGGYHWRYTD